MRMEANMKALVYDDALDAPNAGQCQDLNAKPALHNHHAVTVWHCWGGIGSWGIRNGVTCYTAL